MNNNGRKDEIKIETPVTTNYQMHTVIMIPLTFGTFRPSQNFSPTVANVAGKLLEERTHTKHFPLPGSHRRKGRKENVVMSPGQSPVDLLRNRVTS